MLHSPVPPWLGSKSTLASHSWVWVPCPVVTVEGQLAAGTCEIVTLDRDSSQPRRTIARQTARCACRKGQIAGTTRARPACVDGLLTIAAPAVPPGSGRGSLEILHLSHRPPCCVDTAHSPPPSSTHCSPAA
ncbi:chemokine-like protein TAFA-5 isoform X3 [Meriones unguiculatus]|uniref:chemokine-like protein TAFA-5 isoform X3 n=1 Tax=Meriones unguiculatus TaxID=10047 RepID=UPI00293EB51C|nr:chemokine-like protein TAFA-5 isoform X3 [Meriones unguiculatus]